MKNSTILNFLDVLSSNLKCCLFSKRKVFKSNLFGFDVRMMLSFVFKAIVMLMTTYANGQANVKGDIPVVWPTGGFGVDGDAFAGSPTSGVGDWWPSKPTPGDGGSVFYSNGQLIPPPVGTTVANL